MLAILAIFISLSYYNLLKFIGFKAGPTIATVKGMFSI